MCVKGTCSLYGSTEPYSSLESQKKDCATLAFDWGEGGVSFFWNLLDTIWGVNYFSNFSKTQRPTCDTLFI